MCMCAHLYVGAGQADKYPRGPVGTVDDPLKEREPSRDGRGGGGGKNGREGAESFECEADREPVQESA